MTAVISEDQTRAFLSLDDGRVMKLRAIKTAFRGHNCAYCACSVRMSPAAPHVCLMALGGFTYSTCLRHARKDRCYIFWKETS